MLATSPPHEARPGRSHINDTAQRANGVGPVDYLGAATGILHDRARNHDNILCRACQLLDDEVYHLAQARILVLEELRDAEEERGSFIGREFLAGIQQEGNLGQEDPASSRLDGRAVEEPSCQSVGSDRCCPPLAIWHKGGFCGSSPSWKTWVRSTLMRPVSASSSFLP